MILYFSVKGRLSSSEGMNFTEFTYQIFQAYDWLQLYQKYNCIIQVILDIFLIIALFKILLSLFTSKIIYVLLKQSSDKLVCVSLILQVFSGYSCFLHQWYWLPDITEILLKVALNTIPLTLTLKFYRFSLGTPVSSTNDTDCLI